MATTLNLNAQINLERVCVLVADSSPHGSGLVLQVLSGFGVRIFKRCVSATQAQQAVRDNVVDLVLTDADLDGAQGYDFVRWLRQSKIDPNWSAPVIMLTGHTQMSNVTKGRDCGANFVVAKPLTPTVLLERVLWVVRENRAFIDSGEYVGPERRFRSLGPPAGMAGRRAEDRLPESEAASSMSRSEIGVLQPKRVAS